MEDEARAVKEALKEQGKGVWLRDGDHAGDFEKRSLDRNIEQNWRVWMILAKRQSLGAPFSGLQQGPAHEFRISSASG